MTPGVVQAIMVLAMGPTVKKPACGTRLPEKLLQPPLPLTDRAASSNVAVRVVPATTACSAPAGPKETTRNGKPDAPPVMVLSGMTVAPPLAPAGAKRIVPPPANWLINNSPPRTQWVAASTAAPAGYSVAQIGTELLTTYLVPFELASVETKVSNIKIGDTQIVERQQLVPFLQRLVIAIRWFLILLLSYEWLSIVLSSFPYTRSWGERLNDYLFDIIGGILQSMVGAVPGLGVALAIFMVARVFIGILSRLFERMMHAGTTISWLSPQTMPTSRRLFSVGIWLFAVAMAYPYLPGADTDAFKGLSVLLGLMISLGASSIVGQGAAGLIVTYTGTIRVGEYVRIGDHEGTVVKLGIFTTTVRTGLGEELTMPNSMITGAVTKNYSRTVQGAGYIVDTTVTIGYDTPWRQVEAMLIEAAKRTPGILKVPAPVVFQTALSDYYPEYRLVAQAVPTRPRPRAEVLNMLHANIQDVFNEHGVQIMSPHYMGDPVDAKLVKPDNWYPAPAKRDS